MFRVLYSFYIFFHWLRAPCKNITVGQINQISVNRKTDDEEKKKDRKKEAEIGNTKKEEKKNRKRIEAQKQRKESYKW